ncbi:hypothetical protein [Streptomyces cavernae]|uniref:hypothetical protein n=1 Tax=Streptomyces cavernae TaxID=2259034 RepID=UPI000FEC11B5|nr:hypothetical protein [Streptomyces cavernae]
MFEYELHQIRSDELIRQAEDYRMARRAREARRARRSRIRRAPEPQSPEDQSHTTRPRWHRPARAAS